jgi:hypothetical protein
MEKPKMPEKWKPPFFVHELQGMGGEDPGAIELHHQDGSVSFSIGPTTWRTIISEPWKDNVEAMNAICFALNKVYGTD